MPAKEASKNLAYYLYELIPYRCWSAIERRYGIPITKDEYTEQMLDTIRIHYYNSFKIDDLSEYTDEFKYILAYLYPYVE